MNIKEQQLIWRVRRSFISSDPRDAKEAELRYERHIKVMSEPTTKAILRMNDLSLKMQNESILNGFMVIY